MSINGTNALIGASRAGANVGIAYLFDTETGNLLQTFNSPTSRPSDHFGFSVFINNTNVLIGSPFENSGTGGRAYLFDTETGNLLQTFTGRGGFFGYSVSLQGTNALIGALDDDTGATDAGAAFLFDTETGNLLQTFNNPNPRREDNFGTSVSIDGTNALIGAYRDRNPGFSGEGFAYLYDTETGNLLQTFKSPNTQASTSFGWSVSIQGRNALIGARSTDVQGISNTGIAYLFDTITGDLLQTFNNIDPENTDQFGNSVFIEGKNILIGAFGDNRGANSVGSAYLYQSETDSPTSVPEPSSIVGLFLITGLGIIVKKG